MSRSRGALQDRLTQLWVRATGRRTTLEETPWLDGPVGDPSRIGGDFFERWADREGLQIVRHGGPRGLLPDFDELAGPSFDPDGVHPDVRKFYEETSAYELEAWSEWCGPFRPFGWILSRVFSRRLQQLNVPLRPLDTSEGTTSDVLHLIRPGGGVETSAWIRHLRRTGDVLYAGSYSVVEIPGHPDPCVRVVFPLPHGNANVLLKPSVDRSGALSVVSKGSGHGEPGFYFTVRGRGDRMWVRYVRTMREQIRVFPAEDGQVRADHVMWIFGRVFLRLHYRLRPASPVPGEPGEGRERGHESEPRSAEGGPAAATGPESDDGGNA